MIQSLVRKDAVADLVASYGQVIVDECHHLPAVSFERVLAEVEGALRRRADRDAAAARRAPSDHRDAARARCASRSIRRARRRDARSSTGSSCARRPSGMPAERPDAEHPGALRGARGGRERATQLILNDVDQRPRGGPVADPAHRAQGPSRVLRRRSCDTFARHLVVLQGGMGAKAAPRRARAARRDPDRRGAARPRHRPLHRRRLRRRAARHALPGAARVVEGHAGPVHRAGSTASIPARREVRIFDYVDREVPMLLRMFEKRLRGYRAIGYARGEAPLGYAEPRDETASSSTTRTSCARLNGAGRLRMRPPCKRTTRRKTSIEARGSARPGSRR